MLQYMLWCRPGVNHASICFMLTLTGGMGLQGQVACVQALLRVRVQLEDTRGFFGLLDEHQELFLEAPAAAVQALWLTAQAAAALPALAGFESELVQRIHTWQVSLRSLLHKPSTACLSAQPGSPRLCV